MSTVATPPVPPTGSVRRAFATGTGRRRALALASILAVLVAVLTIVSTAPEPAPAVPPQAATSLTGGEQRLASALRDGERGTAIRAVRTLAAEARKLPAGDAVRARVRLYDAVGSTLRNPRSPLAATLQARVVEARQTGRSAGWAELPFTAADVPAPKR